jgi:hypothetical protein
VRVQCAMCPTVFDAKRPTAKYCSARCRTRASRAGVAAPRQPKARSAVSVQDVPAGVEAATAAELAAAGRAETVSGQSALALARRIDAAVDTGAAMASMVRELRAAMGDAVAGGQVAADPLDELRQRRERAAG